MKATYEDYMRTIYGLYEDLEDKTQGVRLTDVAEKMNISKPSVSEMLRKLLELNYIKWEKYGKIFFTKKGKEFAMKVMHIHRVIEVFLVDVLKVKLDEVHEEAHRLEHAFSYSTIKKLDFFLKNPKISPTKKKIPVIKY